jgi:hypothetical protein
MASRLDILLEKIYARNPLNGHYIIEVSLTNYAEIFNDWDHAPYKRKDINPELLGFLEDSIDDIPLDYDIDICFYLAEETRSHEKEQIITDWFRTFYTFYIEIEKSKIIAILKSAILYMLVSAVLLIVSYFGVLFKDNVFVYTMTEILIVGGWVFLWEALDRLLFQRKAVRRLIYNYERFRKADISFRYSKPPEFLGVS